MKFLCRSGWRSSDQGEPPPLLAAGLGTGHPGNRSAGRQLRIAEPTSSRLRHLIWKITVSCGTPTHCTRQASPVHWHRSGVARRTLSNRPRGDEARCARESGERSGLRCCSSRQSFPRHSLRLAPRPQVSGRLKKEERSNHPEDRRTLRNGFWESASNARGTGGANPGMRSTLRARRQSWLPLRPTRSSKKDSLPVAHLVGVVSPLLAYCVSETNPITARMIMPEEIEAVALDRL